MLASSNEETGARLGLAISKRAAKRAVQRNRLKRIARETFRTHSGLASMDFIVMAGPAAKDASNSALRASLEAHFARLGHRSGPPSHG